MNMKNIGVVLVVGFLIWSAATGRLMTWINLAKSKVSGAATAASS